MAILTSKHQMLGTISLIALSFAFAPAAVSQTTISDEQTAPVETGGQDLTIDSAGSVTIAAPGPAVTLNSDNALANAGSIAITDVDNATGVSLEGGANRSFISSGTINVNENFTAEDTDDDNFIDGPFAQGSGRTGILISGASPFEGNVELTTTSIVDVEGNDSFGINLTNTAMAQNGLTGNLSNDGQINVTGSNATGVNIGSGINGNFVNNGTINTLGQGAQGLNVDADIQGGFVNAGNVINTGFRFVSRPGLTNAATGASGRDQLTAEDLLQAGSAVNIGGNIANGIFLQNRFVDALDADGNPVLDADGNTLQTLASSSNISQNGSAPAIMIDGNGTPLAIGIVAAVTDPTDPNFDANLQYAFVNQGTVAANGVFDDVDATVFQVTDANLTNGINNTGTLQATAFVAPTPIAPNLSSGTGQARVIVLGSGAIVDNINNTGSVLATSSEATDAVFADPLNIPAPRTVSATAIEIQSGASANSLVNSGQIGAVLIGRTGTAVAVMDRNGTLTSLDNSGTISAIGANSDPNQEQGTSFSLVALDRSLSTSDFTLTQSQIDPDTNAPSITGDINLGSGDDTLTVSAGTVTGDIDFATGAHILSLSGGSTYNGVISNAGSLDVNVANASTLSLQNTGPLALTSANFDSTSTFVPRLDGESGMASTLESTGDITFESGATVAPILTGIVGLQNTTFTIAEAGGNLTIGDLATINGAESPFLYNTNYELGPNNTLLVTLDLRDPSTSIAEGGLGLDSVQSAAFASAFTALSSNEDLGNAFANITDGAAFNQAFNQILPEFSAAARQFVIANVDGATGAVSSHLDTARRSPERPAGAWLQEFAYFADRELAGLSEQYRGSGFGFTGGLDTSFGPFHSVGVNIGFASTEIEDVVGIDEPLDVVTIQGGVYGGWASGKLGVEAYAGGGFNDFEQNRQVSINSFQGSSQADWSGTHINGSIRAGYDIELNDKFWFRPTVSVDYLRLSERAFTETGDAGIAISVDGRTSESGSATALFNFGAKFQGKRTWIRPSLRVGYRNEFINDPTVTNFRFIGLTNADGQEFNSADALLQSSVFPDNGIILGFTIAAGSAYSSIGFDFDSDIRDGFIRHTGRVVVRLLF